MSKMIQVRHVPDEVHRTLKARAAHASLSLSDFLRLELEQMAERAQVDDVLAAAEAEAAVSPESLTRIWREVRERDSR